MQMSTWHLNSDQPCHGFLSFFLVRWFFCSIFGRGSRADRLVGWLRYQPMLAAARFKCQDFDWQALLGQSKARIGLANKRPYQVLRTLSCQKLGTKTFSFRKSSEYSVQWLNLPKCDGWEWMLLHILYWTTKQTKYPFHPTVGDFCGNNPINIWYRVFKNQVKNFWGILKSHRPNNLVTSKSLNFFKPSLTNVVGLPRMKGLVMHK